MRSSPPRPYHHGNLRAALVDAGAALAAEGGPDAVVLRAAARRVGVSHNAGYRHFASREELLEAVAEVGMDRLADGMRAGLDAAGLPAGAPDPAACARRRLRAVGWAYLEFAVTQPGLFRTAFTSRAAILGEPGHSGEGDDRGPFSLLVSTVDDLVTYGAMPASRRPQSEMAAWSAVHGLAVLALDGPLHGISPAALAASFDRVADVIEAGM